MSSEGNTSVAEKTLCKLRTYDTKENNYNNNNKLPTTEEQNVINLRMCLSTWFIEFHSLSS